MLGAGLDKLLTTTFTPTDATDYNDATATVRVDVQQAAPTFSGLTASQIITYGAATIDVAGTLSSPTAIPAGQDVTVTINSAATTAMVGAGGSFTATIDTATLPASATPYAIAYGYAGDGNFQSASDSTTTVTVTDLGFEQPAVGTGAFEYNPTGSTWTFSGSAGISGNDSVFTSGNPPAPQGAQVAFLQGYGSFTQSVPASTDTGTYVLTFKAANRGNNGVSQENFEVLIDGSVVGTFTPSSTSYQSYSTVAFPVIAGAAHSITFQGLDSAGGDNSAFIDQVAVALASPSSIGDPGFEQPVVGSGNFQLDPPGSPWGFTGSAGISGNDSGFTSGNPPAPQGAQVAVLQGTGSFTQNVANLVAGLSYVLTFDAAQCGNFGVSQQDFEVLIDGSVVGTFQPTGTTYECYTASFTVTAGATHTITFKGLDSAGGDNTAFLDTTTLTVNKATPTITWANPADITYGTALGDTQLDATATGIDGTSLAGTFAYAPRSGDGPGCWPGPDPHGGLHAHRHDRLHQPHRDGDD